MKRKLWNFFSLWSYMFKKMSFARNILLFYILIMLIGAIVLWLPVSQTGHLSWDPVAKKMHDMNMTLNGVGSTYVDGHMSFLDTLFTSASAFSDTGLSTNSAAVVYNDFGQAVLAILIFIGGIGWFALKVFIFNIIFNKAMDFRTRESLAAERGSVKIGVSRSLIKTAVLSLFIITIIFSITLSVYFFYLTPDTNLMNYNYADHSAADMKSIKFARADMIYNAPHHQVFTSIKYGVFHTISALNNAGFDIIGNNSLAPYYYNIGLQVIFMILFVIGGIGYPVIYDVIRYFRCKATGEKFNFSLFTKVSVTAYVLVALIGLSITFAIEVNSSDSFWANSVGEKYGSTGNKVMALIFNTMSTRNAGFSTISMHDLSHATLIQYVILMFIGSAPSSTAGGIRTTTIAIIVLSLWARLRGRDSVYAFKKRIPTQTVNKAFVVFFISVCLVLAGTFISITSYRDHGGDIWTIDSLTKAGGSWDKAKSTWIDPSGNPVHAYAFTEILFEVGSAFGTTGLSSGLTSQLSVASKMYLILIMFVGQLGVSSSILIWGKRNNIDKHFKWIKQDITIG